MFHVLQALKKKPKRGVIEISQMTVIKLGKIDQPYVPSPFASNQKTKLINEIEFNISIKST